jgi:hypothetical protein
MTDQEIRDDEAAKIGAHIQDIAEAFRANGDLSMSRSMAMLSIAIGEMHVHRGLVRPKLQVVADVVARVMETGR